MFSEFDDTLALILNLSACHILELLICASERVGDLTLWVGSVDIRQ